MKKFIVIYHASTPADANMKADPAEMKGVMDAWMDWGKKCGEGMVDMGTPLGNGKKVTKNGTMPSDKNVVGYSVLQAESMEKAVEMLKEHPHLDMPGACEIEVHEAMPLPM